MIIVIDASNINNYGGGFLHLKEVVQHLDQNKHDIKKIVLISTQSTLDSVEDRPYLEKYTNSWIEKKGVLRFIWISLILGRFCRKLKTDLLFVPGGTYWGGFRPFVVMCQNMLPFEKEEQRLFGYSKMWLKLRTLYYLQIRSFRRANAILYISHYAKNYVNKLINKPNQFSSVIYHGVSKVFRSEVKSQEPSSNYNTLQPFKLLYVSIIDVYKHQWNVIEAVKELNNSGYHIELKLVGRILPAAAGKLNKAMADHPKGIIITGEIPHHSIQDAYKEADAFIFASSCENLSNIVIEAMSSGLPLICSNKASMPEVAENSAFYFTPTNVDSIRESIEFAIKNPEERFKMAIQAKKMSETFDWQKCADETYDFLKLVLDKYKLRNPTY